MAAVARWEGDRRAAASEAAERRHKPVAAAAVTPAGNEHPTPYFGGSGRVAATIRRR